jgi:hypothetical protein
MPRAAKVTQVQKVTKRIGKEAPKTEKITNRGMRQISKLAQLQHSIQVTIATMEDEIAVEKEKLRRIREEDLPTAMLEVGIDKFTTDDGLLVESKYEVVANITQANQEACYEWLTKNGFAGIIKMIVDVQFERGEIDKARKLAEMLMKKKVNVAVKESIHAATLKSFVKERMQEENPKVPFPTDLFGARGYQAATVKPPKAHQAPKPKRKK